MNSIQEQIIKNILNTLNNIPGVIPGLNPRDIPGDISSDIPSDIPSDISSDIPSDIPSVTPSDISSDIPVNIPGNESIDIKINIPGDISNVEPLVQIYPLIYQPLVQKSSVIHPPSTDRKPLCMFGFGGGYNNCLGFLHRSVKPIVGIVKYDFSTWALFPTTVAQCRELALKWSNSFEKRKDFANKSVIIFFHIQMKTIRVEVKERLII